MIDVAVDEVAGAVVVVSGIGTGTGVCGTTGNIGVSATAGTVLGAIFNGKMEGTVNKSYIHLIMYIIN